MNFKAAIFDMDGTLLDSMHIWDHMGSSFLRERSIIPPEGIDRKFLSMSIQDAVSYLKTEFGIQDSAEELLAGVDALAMRLYRSVKPKPGVLEFLTALREKNIPMAVATMSDRCAVEEVLSRTSLLPFFRGIATCGEVGAGKREPAVYDAARLFLGTSREETAVFEDAHFAVRCAKAAGYYTVCVRDDCLESRFEKSLAIANSAILDYRGLDPETL